MTKTHAAAELGVARQTLHDVLSGVTFPDFFTLVKLQDVLQVPVWDESEA